MQKHPSQRRLCCAAKEFAWAAGSCFVLFALTSAFTPNAASAGEVACPTEASSVETNGAILAFPKVRAGFPVDILAIGSSSTEGIGASSPANTYPAQLEDELEKLTGADFDVRNAGVGGELAAKTLVRLKSALNSGWARLVIWQVGTNDALVGVDEELFRATLKAGVVAVRAAGVPLVLVDPQFTLKSPDPARYERFVKMVDDIGAADHVPVVSRYAMMKRFAVKSAASIGSLLSRDGLHMSDFGYRCLAHTLADVIEGAAAAKL